MKELKVISRRSRTHTEEGLACGPISFTNVEAEMVVKYEEKLIFLHAEWEDQTCQIFYEATNESIYDIDEQIDMSSDDFDGLLEKREAIRRKKIEEDNLFKSLYADLYAMIRKELNEHDMGDLPIEN